MTAYIVRRLLLNIPVLLIVSILVYSLMRLLPGDTLMAQIGATGNVPVADMQSVRAELGLDKPFVIQYFHWIGGILHGDFGKSLWTRGSALGRFEHALPVSAELGAFAIVISIAVAIPIGVISAVRQNTPFDYGGRLFSIAWLSMPDFWIGTLVIVFPALWWKYHAPIGFETILANPKVNLEQILPAAFILGFRLSASTMRLTRSSMLEVMRQEYVRTARAKGLTGFVVIVRHALKNALLPVVTVIGTQLGLLVGGQIVLETLFILPGVGQLAFSSIGQRDYTEIQCISLILAMVLLSANLLTDISYAWLDPRIRYS